MAFDEPCPDGHNPSPWLQEQRALNAFAKSVLARAEGECVRMAKRDVALDRENALEWVTLAMVAADVDSRRPLVDVIKTGLATMATAWGEVADQVALGDLSQEEADAIIAAQVE